MLCRRLPLLKFFQLCQSLFACRPGTTNSSSRKASIIGMCYPCLAITTTGAHSLMVLKMPQAAAALLVHCGYENNPIGANKFLTVPPSRRLSYLDGLQRRNHSSWTGFAWKAFSTGCDAENELVSKGRGPRPVVASPRRGGSRSIFTTR